MKNKMYKHILIILLGAVALAYQACNEEYERDLKMRSFFKVYPGNEDDIYFMNENIQFYNYSQHASSYLWDFDDETPTTTEKEPVHVFTKEGEFAVLLKVSNGIDEVEFIDTLTIVVNPG